MAEDHGNFAVQILVMYGTGTICMYSTSTSFIDELMGGPKSEWSQRVCSLHFASPGVQYSYEYGTVYSVMGAFHHYMYAGVRSRV